MPVSIGQCTSASFGQVVRDKSALAALCGLLAALPRRTCGRTEVLTSSRSVSARPSSNGSLDGGAPCFRSGCKHEQPHFGSSLEGGRQRDAALQHSTGGKRPFSMGIDAGSIARSPGSLFAGPSTMFSGALQLRVAVPRADDQAPGQTGRKVDRLPAQNMHAVMAARDLILKEVRRQGREVPFHQSQILGGWADTARTQPPSDETDSAGGNAQLSRGAAREAEEEAGAMWWDLPADTSGSQDAADLAAAAAEAAAAEAAAEAAAAEAAAEAVAKAVSVPADKKAVVETRRAAKCAKSTAATRVTAPRKALDTATSPLVKPSLAGHRTKLHLTTRHKRVQPVCKHAAWNLATAASLGADSLHELTAAAAALEHSTGMRALSPAIAQALSTSQQTRRSVPRAVGMLAAAVLACKQAEYAAHVHRTTGKHVAVVADWPGQVQHTPSRFQSPSEQLAAVLGDAAGCGWDWGAVQSSMQGPSAGDRGCEEDAFAASDLPASELPASGCSMPAGDKVPAQTQAELSHGDAVQHVALVSGLAAQHQQGDVAGLRMDSGMQAGVGNTVSDSGAQPMEADQKDTDASMDVTPPRRVRRRLPAFLLTPSKSAAKRGRAVLQRSSGSSSALGQPTLMQ